MKKTLPLLALPLVLAACGSSNSSNNDNAASSPPTTTKAAPSPPSGGPVKVTESEWAIKPAATSAKAGKVTFDVANDGKIPHEMVVLKTTADKLGGGARVSEKTSVGETGDVAPGKTKKVTLKLKPGTYTLVCNIPAHYQQGMHAEFTVS